VSVTTVKDIVNSLLTDAFLISSHTFTVTNNDKKSKAYTLTHVPAGTTLSVRDVRDILSYFQR
jgi:hypothetical protein